jgi:hypothetical protein
MKAIVNILIVAIGFAAGFQAFAATQEPSDVASVRKWIDQAGNCTEPLKPVSNKFRDTLMSKVQSAMLRLSQEEQASITESAYYSFISGALKKAIIAARPYCDFVQSLNVPPNLAQEAAIRIKAANGPVAGVPIALQTRVDATQISDIEDVENKLFIVSGRDLEVLSQYDTDEETAHSNVKDFIKAMDDSGKRCFYEYTPIADFYADKSNVDHTAIPLEKDVVLKSGVYYPGFSIYGTTDAELARVQCQSVHKYFRPYCEHQTLRKDVWFTPGKMVFKVVDAKGNPIPAARKFVEAEAVYRYQGDVELTIYSSSQKGAMKCLEKQGFAFVTQPSDPRTQSSQLSFLLK